MYNIIIINEHVNVQLKETVYINKIMHLERYFLVNVHVFDIR